MEENEIKSKQHVQVPNDMTKHSDLEMRDLHVYATIKRHLNSKTKECFPSLELLAKESGYSIPTVKKSIDILKKEKWIMVRRDGRKNVYSFNAYKNFEPISPQFLDNENTTTKQKALIIGLQQYMFKDEEGIGKTTLSDEKIASLLNSSGKTISRIMKSLAEEELMIQVKTNAKDSETGIVVNERFFMLDKLGQEVIWTLQKHEDDIDELKEVTDSNSKSIKILLNAVGKLTKSDEELVELKRLLKNNGIDVNELTNDEITL
jgi:DNA-binding MarR family transcriptional regulator